MNARLARNLFFVRKVTHDEESVTYVRIGNVLGMGYVDW